MNEVFAFIVGIEKYDQPDWNVSGPCKNALAITQWLISIGVPARNIAVFLNPIQALDDSIRDKQGEPVDLSRCAEFGAIDTFWRKELVENRPSNSRLLVYWSGHGFTENDGSKIFICRDYTADHLPNRVFNATNFLRYLRSGDYMRFCEQLFLADVCGVYTNLEFVSDKLPPKDQFADVRQIAYFATPEGKYALGDDGRGVFTNIVLDALCKCKGWPGQVTFSNDLNEAFNKVEQTPFRVFSLDDKDEYPSRLVGRVPRDPGDTHFNAVYSLLSTFKLPDTVFRQHYLQTVCDLGNPALAMAQGLSGMIRELASLCDAVVTIQVPYGLLQFLVRLSQENEIADPINTWLTKNAAEQGNALANIREKIETESGQKILMVEVMNNAEGEISSFQPFLRTLTLFPVPGIMFTPQPVKDWDEFTGKLLAVIEELGSKHFITDLKIHFLIDPPLFDRPFHAITTADGTSLGEAFIVLIRYRERLRHATSLVQKNWCDYADALRPISPPRNIKLIPIPPPHIKPAAPLLNERGLCYTRFIVQPTISGNAASSEKLLLLKLLRLGVPYLYWLHQPPPENDWGRIEPLFIDLLKDLAILDKFPEVFTIGRISGIELTSQASLLWDDPQYNPFTKHQGS